MTTAIRGDAVQDTAAAQLTRILLALPALADDAPHALDDVAERAGTDVPTLLRDLRTLVTRASAEPAGWIEPVQLAMDAESVRLDAPGFFRRPMGLTALELEALELGLATLRQETPPEEHGTIDRARERLRAAITAVAAESRGARAAQLSQDSPERSALRQTVQQCVTDRRVVELMYQGSRDAAQRKRRVRPFGLVHARGSWYLVAWCLREDALRVFRLERIANALETDEAFEPPADFQIGDVLRDGRMVSQDAAHVVTIRYSARIARWIEEREEVSLRNEDGSVEVEYPLLGEGWAVRQVLRYGREAEVIAPTEARKAVLCALRLATAR